MALRIQPPRAILGLSTNWPIAHGRPLTEMNNVRTYGNAPFSVAIAHGGPGAPGELAPVARELSGNRGVLEPLQTQLTLHGQVRELEAILRERAITPVTLIGHSWGAMLCFVLAAQSASLIKKLILVSSGVFENKYAQRITETRLSRLTEEEVKTVRSLSMALDEPEVTDKNRIFSQLGNLLSSVDSFDPLPCQSEIIECQYDVYRGVWKDALELRSSGRLLALGRDIRCPVLAIHGDYDPHPSAGVRIPLSSVLNDFRFVLLEKCGHRPWLERGAKDRFYAILEQELR